ncbi:unnamed protein product, partial [Ectocarpus sp. 12 AP-2014]
IAGTFEGNLTVTKALKHYCFLLSHGVSACCPVAPCRASSSLPTSRPRGVEMTTTLCFKI